MWKIIKRAVAVLTQRERLSLVPLILIIVVSALLESVGITLVVPLIAGIMDSSQLTSGVMGDVLAAVFGDHLGSEYVAILLVAMIVLFIVKNAFMVWQTYVQNKVTARIRVRVQNRLMHYHLTRPYAFYLDVESGDVLRTISVDSDYYYSLLVHILSFIAGLIVIVLISLVVFFIHPQMTVILMVVLFAEYLVILKIIRPFLRKQGLEYRRALGHGNSVVIEMVRGIKSIKVGGKESFFQKRYETDVDKLVHARLVEQSVSAVPPRLIEAVTICSILAYLLATLLSGSDMSSFVPVLSAFVLAASRVIPRIGNLSNAVSYAHYYEGSLSNVEAIERVLAKEEACESDAATARGSDEDALGDFEHEIRLSDITFTYPSSEEPVLVDASIVIPHNESIGIVGASGAGKTTLVDILLGLFMLQKGEISMDGVAVDTMGSAWQSKFAYIPQSVFMLAGSIRDNVVFGKSGDGNEPFSDKQVWKALETAQLASFVRTLKDGLDTQIGEAGTRLSGGQIQRLGIARAVFSDAPVLVFDEATSSLDYETEAALMDAIAALRGHKTMVIIAHRPETLEGCDLVYRIDGGSVSVDRA